MPKPTLDLVLGLPDALLQYNFDIIILNAPGGVNSDKLQLQCMNSAIPGRTLEPVPINLFGYEVYQAGRNVPDHTLTVTYVETNEQVIYRSLHAWQEFAVEHRTGHGNSKKNDGYAKNAFLTTYTETGEEAMRLTLINIWPTVISPPTLDGSASGTVNVTVTFQMDEWEITN